MVALIGLSGIVNAASHFIGNPSFEDISGNASAHFGVTGRLLTGHYSFSVEPPDNLGFQSEDPVPRWLAEGEVGSMATPVGATAEAEFSSLPNGQNSLFLKFGSSVFQQLSSRAEPGFRYTLRAKAGRPRSAAGQLGWGGADISLLAGGTVIITAKLTNDLVAGEFFELKGSYTVVAGDAAAGKPLLVAIGAGGCDGIHFDDVTLESEPMVLPQAAIQPAVEIGWDSRLNESYRVERASRLNSPDWVAVTGPLKGTGGRMSLFQIAAPTESFFRVVPVPPQ